MRAPYTCPHCGTPQKGYPFHLRICEVATPEERELYLQTGHFHRGDGTAKRRLEALHRGRRMADREDYHEDFIQVAIRTEEPPHLDADGVERDGLQRLVHPLPMLTEVEPVDWRNEGATSADLIDPERDESPLFFCKRWGEHMTLRRCYDAFTTTNATSLLPKHPCYRCTAGRQLRLDVVGDLADDPGLALEW